MWYIFSGNDNVSANIVDNTITFEDNNGLLGLILDLKLSFEDHINKVCKKASQKLNVLARVTLYIYLEERETVRNESSWNTSFWVLYLSLDVP